MAKYLFGIFRINKRSRPCCLFAGLFKKYQQIQYQCQWSRYRMDVQKILALLPSASFLIANRRQETNVSLLQWSDHIKFIHVEKVRQKNQSMVIRKNKVKGDSFVHHNGVTKFEKNASAQVAMSGHGVMSGDISGAIVRVTRVP